jgi:hypothetical protein
MGKSEIEQLLSTNLMPALHPLFEDEQQFLLNLSDCLKRTAMGEELSDSQKSVIKFDSPFHSSEGDTHSQHEQVDLSEI